MIIQLDKESFGLDARFKNFLLDLDGTLIDPWFGITHSYQYALEKMGQKNIPADKDLFWTIGPPLRENFAILLNTTDTELIEQGAAHYRERFGDWGLHQNQLYAGVLETLKKLKSLNCRLYVATSKLQPFALRILERHQMTYLFDGVYGSELDGTRAEKGDLLAYLLERENLNLAETVMVGDRMHDIIAARKNKMASVGVLYGYGPEAELRDAGADLFIRQPQDLIQLAAWPLDQDGSLK